MKEVWKDIDFADGFYQVSNYGIIRSVDRIITKSNGIKENHKGLTLKQKKHNGYFIVGFSVIGVPYTIGVHRAVALAFIPNPYNKKEVNHKDGNKLNNHVSNLEWATALENTTHAHKMGLIKQNGEDSHFAKLTEKEVIEIFNDKRPYMNISKDYNISKASICNIKKRKSWKHLKL